MKAVRQEFFALLISKICSESNINTTKESNRTIQLTLLLTLNKFQTFLSTALIVLFQNVFVC